MVRHGSASPRKEESSVSRKQQQALPNNLSHSTSRKSEAADRNVESPVPAITPNLKRRAHKLILNSRIPHQTRGMLRYALDIKDPYLPQLVRRVESGEMVIDYLEKIDTPFGKRPAP